MSDVTKEVLGRSLRREFFDDFDGPDLADHWLPFYLPQWSSREASRPRYRLVGSTLTLVIEPDQRPWSPEFNGPVRVSNLQTGVYSGPVGSAIGQHHFRPGLRVREAQAPHQTYTPQYGYLEFACRCHLQPTNVAALWLIGLEHRPEESAELCVFELKGHQVSSRHAVVGYGLRSFQDPLVPNAFFEERMELDVTSTQVYGVLWETDSVTFFVNGRVLRRIEASPRYPMQLMLNLYELEGKNEGLMEFEVDWIAGYRAASHLRF